MKNTMKPFVVACVATIGFIGQQGITAKAITEEQVQKVVKLLDLGQQNGLTNNEIKEDSMRTDASNYIGESLQIPAQTYVLAKHSSKTEITSEMTETVVQASVPEMAITNEGSESNVQSAESEIAITNEVSESDVQLPEPELTVARETLQSDTQSSEPEIETPEEEPEQPAFSISDQEKDLFARLVEAEAKGESYEGKVAVATVVLNRVESPDFPNTVTNVINEVVGKAYAFSPVQNGEINKPASDDSIRAVEEALTRTDRLNDSVYFYNPEIATDNWIRTRSVVKTIGNHVFAK